MVHADLTGGLHLATCGGSTVKFFDTGVALSSGGGDPCVLSYSPGPGSVNAVRWNRTKPTKEAPTMALSHRPSFRSNRGALSKIKIKEKVIDHRTQLIARPILKGVATAVEPRYILSIISRFFDSFDAYSSDLSSILEKLEK